MIALKNSVRKIKINEKKLIAQAEKILYILKYTDFDLGILLTTNKTIRTYNKQYRGKDKPTDILSFSYHPDLKAGQRIKPKTEEDKNLGDLIISLEYVQKDAQKWEQTFEQRMQILLVHGICHLLGYDHEKDEEYEVMHKKEQEILKQLTQ
ncbi:MAG: rRNA maturation RNase YbeY [Candidatus Dependentiae bacterium]|nr:rRNA maturation RNase YbeY [Candidatus Dependentiae bacterium]